MSKQPTKAQKRAKFILVELDSQQVFDLRRTMTVGREHTDLTFPHLSSLSRSHFRLIHEEGDFWIEDTGSSNGTKVNDVKLSPKGKYPLKPGDLIQAGHAKFSFRERPAPKEREVLHEKVVMAPEVELEEVKVVIERPYPPAEARERAAREEMQQGAPKKKRRLKIERYWTVAILVIVFSFLTIFELDLITAKDGNFPHSVNELTRKFWASWPPAYFFIVLAQIFFIRLFARRWYFSVPSSLFAAFLGLILGFGLDSMFGFDKAERENQQHLAQTAVQATGLRAPASHRK
ncbi:MAG: FHA domain-containing protein [Bdellovibrionales bacterium]|nr:FHA domain-containing protein [Bdellovibrionales bacterium]